MRVEKLLGLTSAICGAIGTALLYKGSFAFETLATFSDDAMIAATAKRNLLRLRLQRAGLVMLGLSFALSAIGSIID